MPSTVLASAAAARPSLAAAARRAAQRGAPAMLGGAPHALLAGSASAALRLDALDALPLPVRDAACAGACAIGALAWIRVWTELAASGAVSSTLSRKMVHVGSAPLFVLAWPLFSAAPWARAVAAIVPALNALRLLRAGLPASRGGGNGNGGGSPDALVAAVSRSGERSEVLRGPFIYVLVLLGATVLCWRASAVGVVAIAQMAVGDGVADIVGRRLGGSNRWPFNPSKSVAGSVAFVAGATGASIGLLAWLGAWGVLAPLAPDTPLRLLLISVACAAVELLPTDVLDDNVSVPLVGAGLALALLGTP
ncbi:hypothetical protein KFE25_005252 [Diacronema lutheri]|uniref:Dolichol kinase n=2 Tax=Diacronema lutheri TaxID=2081491 RepID=A0A8J6C688_DIALT|nr:hypothetical protein KFE25_005252 [Diacronema lutheri]